ncbi:MAG: methanol dehydrogenase [cytochrome c] subunit [Proteobacteria bacterium]|nr:methanol dehydrogenase [cytochrome c] subunit [Pseudomonadota bacterium]
MKFKLKMYAIALMGVLLMTSGAVSAYDGTKCKAKGNCWEAKPGYPDKVKGSKYDPKHSASELKKQEVSMAAQEKRNAERAKKFKETGKWVY